MANEIVIDCSSDAAPVIRPIEPMPLESARVQALNQLANIRWRKETSGIVVGGAPIKTDAESQGKLTSAYVMASKDPDFSVRWKIERGAFTTLNASSIIAVGDAVTEHVQACFSREDELTTAILSASNSSELAEIDMEIGWP